MAKFIRTPARMAREETPSPEASGADGFDRLRHRFDELLAKFRAQAITPLAFFEFEKAMKAALDETGRTLLQEELNRLEPADKATAAPKVRYHRATYRINKRTPASIATSFGPITLWSFLYLHEDDGEPGLHPLWVRLGIVAGATPVLAERVGRWAVAHSQREVRQLLLGEHGLQWSNDHLRRVLREFRQRIVAFRAAAQIERLLGWLDQAERSRGRQRPVLAVGRDGVMVPIRQGGYQEASAGTVSVYDRRRKRLGTVYLGQMPETKQTTMTEELNALVKAVLQQWQGAVPRLVYVSDKGQAQDEYYKKTLQKMRHPRATQQRLHWEWVLDFYHVCSYVSKLSDALFGKSSQPGSAWFRKMRHWLRDREQGVTQVLRSATQHYHGRTLAKAAEEEFWKAYDYLRNHSRWMAYARYRHQGLPIGSGVTEAACKIVFTQRLKRSGMRWHKESGQVIVDLRVIYLSGIWDDVVRRDLQARPLPQTIERASCKLATRQILKKAA
jgi:hypothetical protein